MGIKRLVYGHLFAGRRSLGSKKKRSASLVSGSRNNTGPYKSNILERGTADLRGVWGSNRRNLSGVVQVDRRGFGIWRQLDDTYFRNLSGNLEIVRCTWNCILERNGDRGDRNGRQEIEKKEQDRVFTIFGNWLSGGIRLVKRGCKASAIVEMAYLMPVVLLAYVWIIFSLFYYHDKVLLIGAAYESAVVGSELYSSADEVETEQISNYFQNRIRRKLLFFSGVSVDVKAEKEEIIIQAKTQKRGMKIQVIQKAGLRCPEKEIRKIKRIKEGLEGVIE